MTNEELRIKGEKVAAELFGGSVSVAAENLNCVPFIHYKAAVAECIQNNGFPGNAAYQLLDKYNSLLNNLWISGVTVNDAQVIIWEEHKSAADSYESKTPKQLAEIWGLFHRVDYSFSRGTKC